MVRKGGAVPASPVQPAPRVPRERGLSVLERRRAEELVVEQREETRRRVVRKLTLVPADSRDVDGGAMVVADVKTTAMVPSVELHRKTVASKAGKGRRTAAIVPLLPVGSLQVGSKMPRRENFGVEGVEGDEKFEAEMMRFSLEEFGESHAQQRHALQRMRQVGLFGDFLERHNLKMKMRCIRPIFN